MRKKIFYPVICLLAFSLVIAGCGQKTAQITPDSNGYGKTKLHNGILVLANNDPTTSLTAGTILIGGGVLTEKAENNGITNLMINMLLKGNDTMTASEITERLDFLGANVSSNCYRDYSAITFVSLTENFDDVLSIISQCLQSPTFPDEELAKLKHEVEGNIKASNDNQTQASSKLFWKTAYGNDGYGLPTLGTEESLPNISIDAIKEQYQKYVGGKNIIISIATDLEPDQLAEILQNRLGSLRSDAVQIGQSSCTPQEEKTGFISYDRNQSFVFMGYLFDRLKPEQVAYLRLLNEVMGGNVGSRLWFLRQNEKLAYAVYTQLSNDKFGGMFRAAIGTDTSKISLALNSLNREFDKLTSEGITADELKDARVNMKNTMIYYIDTKENRSFYMAFFEYAGYGYKFVPELIKMADQVTLEDINTFIKNYFSNDKRYLAVVGKM